VKKNPILLGKVYFLLGFLKTYVTFAAY